MSGNSKQYVSEITKFQPFISIGPSIFYPHNPTGIVDYSLTLNQLLNKVSKQRIVLVQLGINDAPGLQFFDQLIVIFLRL